MFFLKLLLFALGAAFAVFGVMILFFGRYELINDYEGRRRNGRADEAYARRVGAIELVGGLACVFFAVLSLLFGKWFVVASYICGVGGTVVSLIANEIHGAGKGGTGR